MDPFQKGIVSIDVKGVDCSPIVDKVIATLIPLGSLLYFYAIELLWDYERGFWHATQTKVIPGTYAISVDAEVDEIWISTPEESYLDINSGTKAAVVFKIEDMIKLGKRQFKPTLFPA